MPSGTSRHAATKAATRCEIWGLLNCLRAIESFPGDHCGVGLGRLPRCLVAQTPTEAPEDQQEVCRGQHPDLKEEQVLSLAGSGKQRGGREEGQSQLMMAQLSSGEWTGRGTRSFCGEDEGTGKSSPGEQSLAAVRDMQSHPAQLREGVPMLPIHYLT